MESMGYIHKLDECYYYHFLNKKELDCEFHGDQNASGITLLMKAKTSSLISQCDSLPKINKPKILQG